MPDSKVTRGDSRSVTEQPALLVTCAAAGLRGASASFASRCSRPSTPAVPHLAARFGLKMQAARVSAAACLFLVRPGQTHGHGHARDPLRAQRGCHGRPTRCWATARLTWSSRPAALLTWNCSGSWRAGWGSEEGQQGLVLRVLRLIAGHVHPPAGSITVPGVAFASQRHPRFSAQNGRHHRGYRRLIRKRSVVQAHQRLCDRNLPL